MKVTSIKIQLFPFKQEQGERGALDVNNFLRKHGHKVYLVKPTYKYSWTTTAATISNSGKNQQAPDLSMFGFSTRTDTEN